MDIINNKYYIENPTISNLKKKGFRYDFQSSTVDYKCYSYEFPVDDYNGHPTLICIFRTYLDDGETTVDLRNADGSVFSGWYQQDNPIYMYLKDYLDCICDKIQKEMDKLGIIKKNWGIITWTILRVILYLKN